MSCASLARFLELISPVFKQLTIVWMAIFMDTLINPSVPGAFWVNLVVNIVGIAMASFMMGWLSDRYKRVNMMLFGAISVGIVAPFMVWIISWGKTVEALFAQMCIAILLSFYFGPFPAWMMERFPARIRLTASGMGYNVGICLSSGFTPAIATALVQGIGPVAPGFIYPVFSTLSVIGILISTKKHRDGGIDTDTAIEEEDRSEQRSIDRSIEDELSTHLL